MYGTHDGYGDAGKIKKNVRCMHVDTCDELRLSKKKIWYKTSGSRHLFSLEPALAQTSTVYTHAYTYTLTPLLFTHTTYFCPFTNILFFRRHSSLPSQQQPLLDFHHHARLRSVKMKAVQAVTLFLTTLATTVFRTTSSTATAFPFNPNGIFGDYAVSFRENTEHMVDVGACSRAALSGNQPTNIPFMPVYSQLHWHAINVRLDDFAVGRWAVCNKCVILRSGETDRNVIAVVAGDCSKCVEGEINLTPAAYAAVNEGVILDGITAPGGFLKVVECPKNNEEILKYGYDYNIPAMTIKDVLNYG